MVSVLVSRPVARANCCTYTLEVIKEAFSVVKAGEVTRSVVVFWSRRLGDRVGE